MYFNAVRNRLIYFIIFLLSIVLGLMSKVFASSLPQVLTFYLGDIIWGFMIFIGIAFLFRKKSTVYIVVAALILSFGIEYSQLLNNDILNDLRTTTLGNLILKDGFHVSSLVCYSIGVSVGALIEKVNDKRQMKNR